MSDHNWNAKGLTSPQYCPQCHLTRELAGPWWQYTRGRHFYGIVAPAPPCDPAWPVQGEDGQPKET